MFPGNGKITLKKSWDMITDRAARIKQIAVGVVTSS